MIVLCNNYVIYSSYGVQIVHQSFVCLSLTCVHCFKRCISLSPDCGHAKYLYMGQLTSGEEAVGYLTRGIAVMEKEVEERGSQASAVMGGEVTTDDISAAYCTLAEIYLTDSW